MGLRKKIEDLEDEIASLKEEIKNTKKALDIALNKIDSVEKTSEKKLSDLQYRIQNDYKKSQEERNSIIDEWLNGEKGNKQ